ncbi:MAG TPA: cellulose biosynthesis protein BcsO, partial [Raoultella sp.]|nr:cellulose biosynthesis protein BcsO [Raoultella sp.]
AAAPIPAPAPATAPAPSMSPPPSAAPRPLPAAEGYAHLFATKVAEPAAKDKDQPLKSLLERIATCR